MTDLDASAFFPWALEKSNWYRDLDSWADSNCFIKQKCFKVWVYDSSRSGGLWEWYNIQINQNHHLSVELVAIGVGIVDIMKIGAVSVDTLIWTPIVVANLGDWWPGLYAPSGSKGHIDAGWVGFQWAARVEWSRRKAADLLTYKVPSRVAHAGIQVPVVGGVEGTGDTLSVNAHKAILAEAAAFVEVFVIATYWSSDFIARLSGGIIRLTPGANTTHASDTNVAKQTHAGLSVTRVLLISATLN